MTNPGHDADFPEPTNPCHPSHFARDSRTRDPYPTPVDHPLEPTMDAADPVDFLTNLPGLLGYYPAESLVLVFGDRYLDDPGPVLVRDLD